MWGKVIYVKLQSKCSWFNYTVCLESFGCVLTIQRQLFLKNLTAKRSSVDEHDSFASDQMSFVNVSKKSLLELYVWIDLCLHTFSFSVLFWIYLNPIFLFIRFNIHEYFINYLLQNIKFFTYFKAFLSYVWNGINNMKTIVGIYGLLFYN